MLRLSYSIASSDETSLALQSAGNAERHVEHRYLNAESYLEERHRNPRAAVAGGVCHWVKEHLKRSAHWPPEFPHCVSEAVRSENVRFYGGVLESPSQQAAELCRSCGAVEDE